VLDAIELKNGMILAITYNDILSIKINDDKVEKTKISKVPQECYINEIDNYEFELLINIYELPNNNILISPESSGTYFQNSGCLMGDVYFYKNEQFIFNLDKCKIIHFFQNVGNGNPFSYYSNFDKVKIIIYNNYICISKYKRIYIYNISDYKLIKKINVFDSMIFNYDENMILIINKKYNDEKEKIILYDITNLNNIKYQKIYFDKIISDNNYMFYGIDIKKLSNRKMLVIYNKNIFIIKFSK